MQSYRTSLGHAHLRVRDLDRAIAFYTRFLKLELTERLGGQFAFLTASREHHDLALQAVGAG
ncbi:MAG: VOC family protein, partial [Gemmatimonadaceae bacterium]